MARDMKKRRAWLQARPAPVGVTSSFREYRDTDGTLLEHGVVVEVKTERDFRAKRVYLTREQALKLADDCIARWRRS